MSAGRAVNPSSALPRPAGRRRTVLIGLAIFVCGCLAGAGVTVLAARRIVHHALAPSEEISGRLSGRMARRLDLSAEQERQVRSILSRRRERMMALRGEFRPRMEAELAGVREEVGGMLDERQERAWSAWFDRRCRFWLPGWRPGEGSRRRPPPRRGETETPCQGPGGRSRD